MVVFKLDTFGLRNLKTHLREGLGTGFLYPLDLSGAHAEEAPKNRGSILTV